MSSYLNPTAKQSAETDAVLTFHHATRDLNQLVGAQAVVSTAVEDGVKCITYSRRYTESNGDVYDIDITLAVAAEIRMVNHGPDIDPVTGEVNNR